ncbi:MAG: diacylglycerol kinase family protein [Coriobacteriia bacterium]|nr:diacylglycerol kinase family protein [Actinomycetota bacterium]MDZ4168001.1 diacylglycerol kinase family protein [Coriobacteriia bacterium]
MNILIVSNLRSGLGDPGLYEFIRELGSHHADVTMRFMSEGTDLGHLLRDAHEYARIIAAGGDGTVSAIAYQLRDSGIPLLAYPAGTANLLARNLRLPVDPVDLAVTTMAGRTVSIDLGELVVPARGARATRHIGFAIAAGVGYDASVMETAQGLKQTLGEGAYIIGALQNLAPTVARFTIELDASTIETEGIAVLLVNLARIQFDLEVAHGSDAQDGLLEVVVLKTRTAAGLLPAVWAALVDRLSDHPQRPGLEIHTASHVKISSEPPLPLQYDGEVLPSATPVIARVLPGAATFIVSEENPLPRDYEAAPARP